MIDADLRSLAAEPPDHSLDRLEADVWLGVALHERARRSIRRLLMLQALVLIVASVGSLAAGEHEARSVQTGNLDVFSSRMPLSASTLLLGSQP